VNALEGEGKLQREKLRISESLADSQVTSRV